MGHVGALCPDRPGFCPVVGIDQWFQWALHNRDIVSQNESLNPISGTDFREKNDYVVAAIRAIKSIPDPDPQRERDERVKLRN